jgi:hypothetical protein
MKKFKAVIIKNGLDQIGNHSGQVQAQSSQTMYAGWISAFYLHTFSLALFQRKAFKAIQV